jgi:ATP-binding cassette, subfamily F, member 3
MLHIQDLTFRIGPRLLFDRASAALPEGGRIGLVGRNGAGKTTLFRMMSGELAQESGEIAMPRRKSLGRVEQEAPSGPGSLIDFVLAADVERAALLQEAEIAADPHRIAEIQTRLADIGSHGAPARAARILAGLGFDEAAQNRSLSEFSGGWRMRVALAAVLFSQPDLLLLDEPTNYLDLEGTLWLVDYLSRCPATLLVISHDRDLLDAVCDHILHLDQAKLSLWRGNYSSFERQRGEALALQAKHRAKQEAQRAHLQAFVDRFRAQATKARQAQSRLKMLAKMPTIAAAVEEDVAPFDFPSPAQPLSPPIVTMERASVGYGGAPILSRLDLVISNDDRIGLLGSNGNGKSTFAKLVAGRLAPSAGAVRRASKLAVGFFAQHQVDDLETSGTAYTHVAAQTPGEPEAKIRARCARIGFSSARADTRVAELSGGEKARLLMGLATLRAPQLLILDEPTNHLDIDSRSALLEAINDYEGAVILVSHDRRLLEACADRLWLVADGTVKPFDGDLEDYRRYVLERSRALDDGDERNERASQAEFRREAARARLEAAPLRKKLADLDQRLEKLNDLLQRVDAALGEPDAFAKDPARAAQLASQRGELERTIAACEEDWLELAAQIENRMEASGR